MCVCECAYKQINVGKVKLRKSSRKQNFDFDFIKMENIGGRMEKIKE